jgi:nucleoside-diphosphate-sugar epimerase
MRIFLTGATGFIGSAIIPEFLNAGHQVLGLTRSDAGAAALLAAGAEVHRGELSDLDSLRSGAAQSDGVIHCAFNHDAFTTNDFSKFIENCRIDKRAIDAIGSVLAGSNRPLIVSSGIGAWTPGHAVTEDIDPPANSPVPRVSEESAISLAAKGVNPAVVRLPQVHNPVKQGLVTYLVAVARAKGVSAYINEGLNVWPAAHVLDVAHLYKLAFDQLAAGEHQPGAKYHAVAEQGVPLKDIAEAIGRGLNIPVISVSPEEAPAHFGWLAAFVGFDLPASSAQTQQRLGWNPTGPTMLADLAAMDYS